MNERGSEAERRFACSLLSLRKLLLCQLTLQVSEVYPCIIILSRCRQQEPLVSLDVILRHALALSVADAQIALRLKILFGSFAKPLQRLLVVLRHTLALIIAVP